MTIPDIHEDEKFRAYLPQDDKFLNELEERSRENDVAIIGSHVGGLLNMLVKMTGARRILELGTANGYSSIWMAKALREIGKKKVLHNDLDQTRQEGGDDGEDPNTNAITTMEWDMKVAEEARKNIADAGVSDLVTVIQGDARQLIESLGDHIGPYDMIFLDVEKEFYSDLLDPCIELLRQGGLLVFDNTAFVTAGDFLDRSFKHPALQTIHLFGFLPNHGPEYDAITLALKI